MNRDTLGTRTPRRSERLLFTGAASAPSDRSSEFKVQIISNHDPHSDLIQAFADRGNHTPVERTARRSTKV